MAKRIISIEPKVKNNTTLLEAFEEFIAFKEAQGLSERTRNDYYYHINKLLENTANNLELDNLKIGVIATFKEISNKSAVTFNMRYKYLNCFFNYCTRENIICDNPIKLLKLKKKKETPRIIDIDINIIEQFLKLMDLNTYVGLRDYTITLVLLDTGVRPNELMNVSRDDINLKANELKIKAEFSKTRRERTLPLSNVVVKFLKRLMEVTPKEWGNNVFYTCEGNLLTSERLGKVFITYSKKLGYNISPYGLRHEFAILYLRNNGNVFSLQKLLGHSHLDMTKRYLAISQVDLKEQHSTASPVNMFVKKNKRLRKV